MVRGITMWALAGALVFSTAGTALAKDTKKKTDSSAQTDSSSQTDTVKDKKKVKGKSHLKGHDGVLHVHVRNKDGKAATAAVVVVKSGHKRVVQHVNRAGRATLSIAGHKSVTVKAHNNHHAHATAHTGLAAGSHSTVMLQLRGGRSSGAKEAVAGVKHDGHTLVEHHAHQAHDLGVHKKGGGSDEEKKGTDGSKAKPATAAPVVAPAAATPANRLNGASGPTVK